MGWREYIDAPAPARAIVDQRAAPSGTLRAVLWLIRSAMTALYPRAAGLPGVADTELDAFLLRFRREAPALMWLGLCLGAVVFALTPVLTVGRPLPSFWLSERARDRHANKIASHPLYLLRQTVFLLKMVAGMCWAEHPAVRARLHLAPYPSDPGTFRTR